MKKLDICIPTYNRAAELIQTLSSLLKYKVECIANIYVIDNCSDWSEEESTLSRLRQFENAGIRIIKNIANIGMSANIMRCFETGSSEYLLILSDDDEILPDITEVLESCIYGQRKWDVYKFRDPEERTIESFEELVRVINDPREFNSFIFLSNVVYRRSKIAKYLENGYQNAQSYVPHFMMLAELVRDGGQITTSEQTLVKYKIARLGYSYSMVAGLGVGCQKNLLLNQEKKIRQNFLSAFYPHNDFKVLLDLHYCAMQKGNQSDFDSLSSNYLQLVKTHRSIQRNLALRIFKLAISMVLTRRAITAILSKSERFRTHLNEIEERYG